MTIALSQCPGITGADPAALQAALNLKQPIMADCPVTLTMGTDPNKCIFIPDGTNVTFTPQGRFDVDAVGFPAFAAMNTASTWAGLKVRYTGTPSVISPAASAKWNDGTAKAYLTKSGVTQTYWTGPTNTSALFAIRGLSAFTATNTKIYVDDGVTADRFPPVMFCFDTGYSPGGVLSIPSSVLINGIEMDGSIMGFTGSATNLVINKAVRRRYADLQDAAGGTVGGVNCWLAPPHWMYLQGTTNNPMKATITDAIDEAVYCGAALRRPTSSGFMNSIKLELVNGSSINGYYSRCLDGGLGVLSNIALTGGQVRNAHFIIDTSIMSVDGKCAATAGLFFPSSHVYPASDIEVSIRNLATNAPAYSQPSPTAGMRVRVTVEQ